MYYGLTLPLTRSSQYSLHYSFSTSTSFLSKGSITYFWNPISILQMSSNYYSRPPRNRRDVSQPMAVSNYTGLMITGRNHTWPDSRRSANMRVNIDDVNAEIVIEDGHKYMYAAGGWLKRWQNLDNVALVVVLSMAVAT